MSEPAGHAPACPRYEALLDGAEAVLDCLVELEQ